MNLRAIFTDNFVQKRYVSVGNAVGDSLSYAFMGEPVGFNHLVLSLGRWEKEYARRGYRTISVDAFIDSGGFGDDISKLVGVRRELNEEPVYHASRLLEERVQAVTSAAELLRGDVSGSYTLPSTER